MNDTCEYFLAVTDSEGTETIVMSGSDEAHRMIGRVMEEFIANGYKIACPLNNPGYWVSICGDYVVDIRLIVIGVN